MPLEASGALSRLRKGVYEFVRRRSIEKMGTRVERKDWQVEEVLTACSTALRFWPIAHWHGGLLLVARLATTLVSIAQQPGYHHRTMEPTEGHVASSWSYNDSRCHGWLYVLWETPIFLIPSRKQGGQKWHFFMTGGIKPSRTLKPYPNWKKYRWTLCHCKIQKKKNYRWWSWMNPVRPRKIVTLGVGRCPVGRRSRSSGSDKGKRWGVANTIITDTINSSMLHYPSS